MPASSATPHQSLREKAAPARTLPPIWRAHERAGCDRTVGISRAVPRGDPEGGDVVPTRVRGPDGRDRGGDPWIGRTQRHRQRPDAPYHYGHRSERERAAAARGP